MVWRLAWNLGLKSRTTCFELDISVATAWIHAFECVCRLPNSWRSYFWSILGPRLEKRVSNSGFGHLGWLLSLWVTYSPCRMLWVVSLSSMVGPTSLIGPRRPSLVIVSPPLMFTLAGRWNWVDMGGVVTPALCWISYYDFQYSTSIGLPKTTHGA